MIQKVILNVMEYFFKLKDGLRYKNLKISPMIKVLYNVKSLWK